MITVTHNNSFESKSVSAACNELCDNTPVKGRNDEKIEEALIELSIQVAEELNED